MAGQSRNRQMPVSRVRGGGSPRQRAVATMDDKNFQRMKKGAERMRLERSGLLPENVERYVGLKKWYKEHREDIRKNKMIQNDLDIQMARKQHRELARPFGGKTFGDKNIGVLGCPTIWAREWEATEDHPQAPWPNIREFREEGDERHTSNYGRYLPVPRVPGNKTVVYKQKSFTTVEEMDAVITVPKVYGMVNPKMYGFFETEVDDDGVPYDDEDLPGGVYFNPEWNTDAPRGVSSLPAPAPSVSTEPKDTLLDSHSIFGKQPESKDPLDAQAPAFCPRVIPALNPGKTRDDEETDPFCTDKAKKPNLLGNFLGPLQHITSTSEQQVPIQPPPMSYSDAVKSKQTLRNSLRINTDVDEFRGNSTESAETSTVGVSSFRSMKDMAPGAAFRMLNPHHENESIVQTGLLQTASTDSAITPASIRTVKDLVFSAVEPEDPRSGLSSPLELPNPTAFSSRSRANRPTPLKLDGKLSNKYGVKSADIKSPDNDSGDEDDGGVKL